MRGKILISLFIVAAIGITIFAVHLHNKTVRYQAEAASTVNECVSELLLIAKVSGPIREEYSSRYDAISASIKLFEEENRDINNPFSDKALKLCTDISEVIIENERHILEVISTAQSSRMSDPGTMKNETEYQWRIDTIDELKDVVKTIGNYEAVLIDKIRAAMVASDLPRESKVAIYSHIKELPITQSRSQRKTVFMIRELLDVEQNIIELLYKNRDKYEISEIGNIIFSDDAVRTEFNTLAVTARESRRKLSRLGSAAFFGQKPLINPPIT